MSYSTMFSNNPSAKYLTLADYEYLGEFFANILLKEEPKDADDVTSCPECKGKIKKNGHSKDGIQRYKCLSCGHSFNSSSSYRTLTYHSHLSKEIWHKFIVEMFANAYRGNNSVPVLKEINKNTATLMFSKVNEKIYLHSNSLNEMIDKLTKKKREIPKKKQ